MYVINPEIFNKDKVYKCNAIIGQWLVEKKNVPVLGIKNGTWYFSITEKLEETLESVPFFLNVRNLDCFRREG